MRTVEVVRSADMEPTEVQRVRNLEKFLQDLLRVIGEEDQVTLNSGMMSPNLPPK